MSRTGCELKCYEQYGAWRPVNTGHWECMNDISQGLTWSNRIANQVQIKHVSMRGYAYWGNNHTNPGDMRIMVFLDKQCGGTTPTLAEMFFVNSATYLTWAEPIYWLYRDRFIPLYDMPLSTSVSYGGANVGNDSNHYLDFEMDCNIVTQFKSNTGTVSDIVGNALFLWAYAPDALGVETPFFNWWTRVLYTDC